MGFVNLGDSYAMSGSAAELLQRYGLTAGNIAGAVRSVVKRKAAASR